MVSEQSLLQTIRKKELEMNVLIEEARSEAAALIEEARKDAEAIIMRCIGAGEEEGKIYYEKEIEAINREIEAIAEWRQEQELAIRNRWEKNIRKAVETLVEHVGAGS